MIITACLCHSSSAGGLAREEEGEGKGESVTMGRGVVELEVKIAT